MRRAEPFNSANRSATARRVVGIFSPQRPLLKVDAHSYSPTMLHKILSATAEVKSHQKAAHVLGLLCELPISGRQVNRLAEEVGLEMAARSFARKRELQRKEQPRNSFKNILQNIFATISGRFRRH